MENDRQTCTDNGKSALPALLACPFCGGTPEYPDGNGTQYELFCDCGMALAAVQISDLMTWDERVADGFINYRYRDEYVERAKAEVTKMWNTRTG